MTSTWCLFISMFCNLTWVFDIIVTLAPIFGAPYYSRFPSSFLRFWWVGIASNMYTLLFFGYATMTVTREGWTWGLQPERSERMLWGERSQIVRVECRTTQKNCLSVSLSTTHNHSSQGTHSIVPSSFGHVSVSFASQQVNNF